MHLQLFPDLPAEWRDAALAQKWDAIRAVRRRITTAIENERTNGNIKSSLQAAVVVPLTTGENDLLNAAEWDEVAIVSAVELDPPAGRPYVQVKQAPGSKCVRCWRVLTEVGEQPNHPTLCARCADAVESGLVCRPAA